MKTLKSRDFVTGYKCGVTFYLLECIAILIVSIAFKDISLPFILGYIALAAMTVAVLFRGKKKHPLSENIHMRVQAIAFIINNVLLSVVVDSAQVFIYAMCFSSIVCFIFLDRKLVSFNFWVSMIVIALLVGVIILFIRSDQTILEFSVGIVVFVIINWVIVSMTSMINYQNRKNYEQERSLDDLLKVVEAKCYDAQAATRSKTRFLAHMSHEIRTPINAVMGMNEMILRESTEPQVRGYAADAKLAAESLLGIINDILDITKIEAGKLALIDAEYNMPLFISDVYNMMRFKAEDKGLELKIVADPQLPVMLRGDDVRLKQVLINLISNAIKYTHEGSVIFNIEVVDAEHIRYSVKDTGIGIKAEDIKLLFNAFERIEEDRNRSIEGTGLGLNITASLLRMFGTELQVESVYGEGSEFYFILRQEVIDPTPMGALDLAIAEHEVKSYTTHYEAPNANILVVDDNDMNRKVFIQLLKDTKLNVSDASSGSACLEMIKDTHYDIIFMDHMMPEMDGVETLEKIRSDATHKCVDTPVIILTANAVAGAKDFYETVGFDGFLSKPIDPKSLEKEIFTRLDKSLVHQHKVEEMPAVSSTAERVELPLVEGVDWGYARMHFGDDGALMATISMFLSALKPDANELQGYFIDIDEEECRSSYITKVHSMKSSAAVIGIVQLAGMAMELESAAKNMQLDTVRAMHPVFIERWLSYRGRLSPLTDNGVEKEPAADHREQIAAILADIEAAAADMDIDKLDELSKQLDVYRYDEQQEEKLEKIKNDILNFRIEELTALTL